MMKIDIPPTPQDPPTRLPGDLSRPQWNYENCKAQLGTVLVGKPDYPTWWCAEFEGQRLPAIKVTYPGAEPFYIYDDAEGRAKVFQRGGGPGSGHKGLTNVSEWLPGSEVYGSRQVALGSWWKRTRRTGGGRRAHRTRKIENTDGAE